MTKDQFNRLQPGSQFKYHGEIITVSTIETRSEYDEEQGPDGRWRVVPDSICEVTFCVNTTNGRRLKENDREVSDCLVVFTYR